VSQTQPRWKKFASRQAALFLTDHTVCLLA